MRITHSQLVAMFRSFSSASDDKKFSYISLYISYYETTSYFTDPLLTNSAIDSACLDFLLSKAREPYIIYKDTASSLAIAYLGIVYEIGCLNCTRNIDQALTFYLAASKQNNALGAFRLAQVFERLKDIEKSILYYRLASKLGSLEAAHTYGIILMYGYGVDKNPSTGLFYLKRAAAGATVKYPFALYDLAKINEESDPEYALELYTRGAELEDPNCQYMLAKIYENGELYQERDHQKSKLYYECAAKQGHTEAMYTVALKTDSINHAFEMAYGAAARGHAGAAEMTGDLIERGMCTSRDPAFALWWYIISKDLGNVNCDEKIQALKKYAADNKNIKFKRR